MSNEDGTVWVAFNGEVYNFLELRRELQQQGVRFVSTTDTEVVLMALHTWGVQEAVPLLARVYPNGSADVNHFHAAGRLHLRLHAGPGVLA